MCADVAENFDDGDDEFVEGGSHLKRRAPPVSHGRDTVLESASKLARTTDEAGAPPMILPELDEGPGTVWNISKVRQYQPVPGTPPTQRFWGPNGDEKLSLSPDGLSVSSSAGYRMARAAFGVSQGACYFEIAVPAGAGAVRLGWSLVRGDPEATVGYDDWGYGMRTRDGYKFNGSRGRSYGVACVPGDVVGAYIYLPPRPADEPDPQPPQREHPCAEIVLETADYWAVRILPDTQYSLPTNDLVPVARRGSFISFYRNGRSLGVAFRDIWAGWYVCAWLSARF